MTTVASLLSGKSSHVWTVEPGETVYDAIAAMAKHEVGALPVVEDGGLVGIISERDYGRKVILKGRASKDTPVHDIMTPHVITVSPEASIDRCMELMTDHHIRHLPVVEGGRLIGMLSIRDVVKCVISEREDEIQDLERYITGAKR